MNEWDLGPKAKNNLRAKTVISISRIYYDEKEDDVINVI